MEDNNANIVEVEETSSSPDVVSVEVHNIKSGNGVILEGVIGGLIAYAIIDGCKRLWNLTMRLHTKKKHNKHDEVITVDIDGDDTVQSDDEQ